MSNITENRIDIILAQSDIDLFNSNITDIDNRLPNISLTETQRATFLSMDVDNKVFAEDAANEVGVSGASFIPPFISVTSLKNDIVLFEQMDVLESGLKNLLQKVQDVKRTAADEAMTVANVIYKMYEMANIAGVPDAKQGYEKLKERYKRQSTSVIAPTP